MNLTQLNGKPGVSSPPTTNLNVWFANLFTINLPIQYSMKNSAIAEKTSNEPTRIHPALFQVAARTDISVPIWKDAPSPLTTPFVDLMLDKRKLETVLKTFEKKKPVFSGQDTEAPRNSGTKSTASRNNRRRKPSGALADELRQKEFQLRAPSARSVRLAAEFTDWEKSPLDMVKSENGVWFATVPLSPGNYAYRFIVDGRWCNDPQSAQRVPNPFGTDNAVANVT